MPAPIAMFVYNRPDSTRQSLHALSKNELSANSSLFIFSDGPKQSAGETDIANIQAVRSVIREKQWCKNVQIFERTENMGLAKSIVNGVNKLIDEYGSVIVLEDDLVISRYFLKYMNDALEKYKYTEEVICIHGYSLPVSYEKPLFFLKGADCWGWATWQRGWCLYNPNGKALLAEIEQGNLEYEFNYYNTFDYTGMLKKQTEGKINSWAILWYASAFLKKKLTLYPGHSIVKNIGLDQSGTHPQNKPMMNTEIFDQPVDLVDIPIEESREARKKIAMYFFRKSGLVAKMKSISAFIKLLFMK